MNQEHKEYDAHASNRVLSALNGRMTSEQIAAKIGVDEKYVRNAFRTLEQKQLVTRVDKVGKRTVWLREDDLEEHDTVPQPKIVTSERIIQHLIQPMTADELAVKMQVDPKKVANMLSWMYRQGHLHKAGVKGRAYLYAVPGGQGVDDPLIQRVGEVADILRSAQERIRDLEAENAKLRERVGKFKAALGDL